MLGRVTGPGQSAWTQEDTDLAVALTELEADRCDGCGHPRSESMAREAEDGYRAEPIRCHACAARDRKARGMGEHFDDAGIRWSIVRRDDGG